MDATNDPNISIAFVFIRQKKTRFHYKKIFSEETLLTVRTCGSCILARVQEFARIVFVDDILNHVKKIEDHRPLLNRPHYASLMHLIFGPKVVRLKQTIFYLYFNNMNISL